MAPSDRSGLELTIDPALRPRLSGLFRLDRGRLSAGDLLHMRLQSGACASNTDARVPGAVNELGDDLQPVPAVVRHDEHVCASHYAEYRRSRRRCWPPHERAQSIT